MGGPSIVFTRKAVADETVVPEWTNLGTSIVGIAASHLDPYSMCQHMPTRFTCVRILIRKPTDLCHGRRKPEVLKNGHVLFSTNHT